MSTSGGFSIGPAPPVTRRFRAVNLGSERPYDVAREGALFVGTMRPAGDTVDGTPVEPVIQVVLNWFEELKQRAPAGGR